MQCTTVEIKARSTRHTAIRQLLKSKNADYQGLDHQIDTYFNVPYGRLKLREGAIENYLIHYQRENKQGPKQSNVSLFKSNPESSLKEVLTRALGTQVVVDKQREIYWIENVKFHIDEVKNLGTFIEIEAIDQTGVRGLEKLHQQCEFFLNLFGIANQDLLSESYSDLLIRKTQSI